MNKQSELYVGLISGTSADGIDAVVVDFSREHPRLLASLAYPMADELRQRLYKLMLPGDNEIDQVGVIDQLIGEHFASAALAVIEAAGLVPDRIAAIGSHGQTLRHRPPGAFERAFTYQVGDPNLIAERTGITTVADFRRRDMAAGGQGAPLVPAFHNAVFRSDSLSRAVVNIGGISNITWLPAQGSVLGFDTGPGNGLMDSWIHKHQGLGFDRDGAWAAGGRCDESLLNTLLAHPYFAKPIPKSTGREEFHLPWLESVLKARPPLAPVDVQATLLNLTAHCIHRHLQALPGKADEIYICGGGAHNGALMKLLSDLVRPARLASSAALGIEPDWVEAMAFAWLAKQTLERKTGNLASVTGATRPVILGGVYWS